MKDYIEIKDINGDEVYVKTNCIVYLFASKRKDYYSIGFIDRSEIEIDEEEYKRIKNELMPSFAQQLQELDFKAMIADRIKIQDVIEPTIHGCINLLKQEGKDTKQQVLEKLEELVNAN